LIVLGGCSAAGTSLSRTEPSSAARGGEDVSAVWVDNLERWLRLAYSPLDESSVASFGHYRSYDLENPGLSQTVHALRILERLGIRPVDRTQKLQWLYNLQGEAGAYREPRSVVQPPFDTQWAVECIRLLGGEPPLPDSTLTYLTQYRTADGLFSYGPEDQAPILTTGAVLRTLADLGTPRARALAGESVPALRDALNAAHAQSLPGSLLTAEEIGAYYGLALAAPEQLTSADRALVRQSFTLRLENSEAPPPLELIDSYLEIHDQAPFLPAGSVPGYLAAYAGDVALPFFESASESRFTPTTFIDQVYAAVNVMSHARVAFSAEGLRDFLERTDTGPGWMLLPLWTPSVEATVAGLGIATTIDREPVALRPVVEFLRRDLLRERDVVLSRDYLTLSGMHLLDVALSASDNEVMFTRDTEYVRALREETFGYTMQMYWYARLALMEGWDVPADLRHKIALAADIDRLIAKEPRPLEWAVLDTVGQEHKISADEIESQVMDLRSGSGFKESTLVEGRPMLHSTRYALEALATVDRVEAVPAVELEAWVWSLAANYGFVDYTAKEAEEPAWSDLVTTWDGLWVLRTLGAWRGVKPRSQLWLPVALP